ncbi:MAG: prepilin-type N-terminal cleavage/methylation domain-containing protein [Elusimicrobia bacterium]|nr:prepilin-type N-terminal cleavage/methylation domain-containing protein [Elusimicrobiota bacterium]
MKKTNKTGFTLIELVITIALIVVLSMVSTPLYKNYTKNSKRSEGYLLLGAIRDAQMQYLSEYRCFLSGDKSSIGKTDTYSCKEDVLGIDARGNKYFTAFKLNYASGSSSFIIYVTSKEAGQICLNFNRENGAKFS